MRPLEPIVQSPLGWYNNNWWSTCTGSAADLCKAAMVATDGVRGSAGGGARLLLQIHDELLWELDDREFDTTAGKYTHRCIMTSHTDLTTDTKSIRGQAI